MATRLPLQSSNLAGPGEAARAHVLHLLIRDGLSCLDGFIFLLLYTTRYTTGLPDLRGLSISGKNQVYNDFIMIL